MLLDGGGDASEGRRREAWCSQINKMGINIFYSNTSVKFPAGKEEPWSFRSNPKLMQFSLTVASSGALHLLIPSSRLHREAPLNPIAFSWARIWIPFPQKFPLVWATRQDSLCGGWKEEAQSGALQGWVLGPPARCTGGTSPGALARPAVSARFLYHLRVHRLYWRSLLPRAVHLSPKVGSQSLSELPSLLVDSRVPSQLPVHLCSAPVLCFTPSVHLPREVGARSGHRRNGPSHQPLSNTIVSPLINPLLDITPSVSIYLIKPWYGIGMGNGCRETEFETDSLSKLVLRFSELILGFV